MGDPPDPLCWQDVLDRTRVKKAGIHAFVELHIEQGPVLEKAREELGLVTAIAAVRGLLPLHVDITQSSTQCLAQRPSNAYGHCPTVYHDVFT